VVAVVTGRAPRAVRTLDTDDGLVVLVTLGLEGETTLAAAHDEASVVEERIRDALPGVADVVVHTEP
jgi:divalent metal cation (Fe/Co/Zn/Cd) transporter